MIFKISMKLFLVLFLAQSAIWSKFESINKNFNWDENDSTEIISFENDIDWNSSFAFLSFSSSSDDASQALPAITEYSGNGMTISRAKTGSKLLGSVQILSFSSGVKVYRGSSQLIDNELEIDIPKVDPQNSFVIINVQSEKESYGSDQSVIPIINSNSTLKFKRKRDALPVNIFWQVVEHQGVNVIHHEHEIEEQKSRQWTHQLPQSVDPEKTLILTYQTNNEISNSNNLPYVHLLNSDYLRFQNQSNGQSVTFFHYLISFKDGTNITHNSSNLETGNSILPILKESNENLDWILSSGSNGLQGNTSGETDDDWGEPYLFGEGFFRFTLSPNGNFAERAALSKNVSISFQTVSISKTPEIVSALADINAPLGTKADFSVSIRQKNNIWFRWFLNDELIEDEISSKFSIETLEAKHDGLEVRCEITNQRDTINTSAKIRILRHDLMAPKFKTSPGNYFDSVQVEIELGAFDGKARYSFDEDLNESKSFPDKGISLSESQTIYLYSIRDLDTSDIIIGEFKIFGTEPEILSPEEQIDISESELFINSSDEARSISVKDSKIDEEDEGLKLFSKFLVIEEGEGQVEYHNNSNSLPIRLGIFEYSDEEWSLISNFSDSYLFKKPGTYFLAEDLIKPSYEIQSQEIGGKENLITFKISDNSSSLAYTLKINSGSKNDKENGEIDTDDLFEIRYPNNSQGARASFELSDGLHSVTFPKSSESTFPLPISAENFSLPWPKLDADDKWHLIGIPGEAGDAINLGNLVSASVAANVTGAIWNETKEEYDFLLSGDKIPNSRTLWIQSKTTLNEFKIDYISGKKLNKDGSYSMDLKTGWNQITNPTFSKIFWPVGLSEEQRAKSKIKTPWSYTDENWKREIQLNPFEGYFVYNHGDDTTIELISKEPKFALEKTAELNLSKIKFITKNENQIVAYFSENPLEIFKYIDEHIPPAFNNKTSNPNSIASIYQRKKDFSSVYSPYNKNGLVTILFKNPMSDRIRNISLFSRQKDVSILISDGKGLFASLSATELKNMSELFFQTLPEKFYVFIGNSIQIENFKNSFPFDTPGFKNKKNQQFNFTYPLPGILSFTEFDLMGRLKQKETLNFGGGEYLLEKRFYPNSLSVLHWTFKSQLGKEYSGFLRGHLVV